MSNELLFKDDKLNNKGNCYGRNKQKQELEPMLFATFA